MQREKGIGGADVRVLIVSTEWRELLAPFSQAVREWSANLRGYQLMLERDGVTPVGVREVRPLDEASLVDATPIQLLIQPNDGDLEGAWRGIRARMARVGVTNLIGFDIRHPVYDPGIYLVLGRIPREGDAVARLMRVANDRKFDTSGAPEGYEIEYVALHYLCSGLTGLRLEHAGPHSLAGIVQDTRWEVAGVRRGGVFEEALLFPANELIASASFGGISDVAFIGSAKSDHRQRWNRFTVRVRLALSANVLWSALVSDWLQELADVKSPCRVWAKIFNPCDLVSAFAFGWPDNLEGYLPSIELVATDRGRDRILRGTLVSLNTYRDVMFAFERVYEDPVRWGILRTCGGVWRLDQRFLRELGVDYAVFEWSAEFPDGAKLEYIDNQLTRRPPDLIVDGSPQWHGVEPMPELISGHKPEFNHFALFLQQYVYRPPER